MKTVRTKQISCVMDKAMDSPGLSDCGAPSSCEMRAIQVLGLYGKMEGPSHVEPFRHSFKLVERFFDTREKRFHEMQFDDDDSLEDEWLNLGLEEQQVVGLFTQFAPRASPLRQHGSRENTLVLAFLDRVMKWRDTCYRTLGRLPATNLRIQICESMTFKLLPAVGALAPRKVAMYQDFLEQGIKYGGVISDSSSALTEGEPPVFFTFPHGEYGCDPSGAAPHFSPEGATPTPECIGLPAGDQGMADTCKRATEALNKAQLSNEEGQKHCTDAGCEYLPPCCSFDWQTKRDKLERQARQASWNDAQFIGKVDRIEMTDKSSGKGSQNERHLFPH